MTKHHQRQSFADIVRDVQAEAEARDQTTSISPGFNQEGLLVDPEGRHYEFVDDSIPMERAHELASRGAALVWDACGCGGYCGLEWYSQRQVAELVAWGPPEIRGNPRKRNGWIAEYRSADGQQLLLAYVAVRWGELLD